MCTVSFIPRAEGYILTSNRDENPYRDTVPPGEIKLSDRSVLTAPKDALAGGTWIATDLKGRTACLLNGALQKHNRRPEYRLSRGRFVLEAFRSSDFERFAETVVLRDIEPFTMLLVEPGSLLQLIWDGQYKQLWELSSATVHLWSSVTLYTPAEHAQKERYFMEALERYGPDSEHILQIHGRDYETPIFLNQEKIRTVSITQVRYDGEKSSMDYYVTNKQDEKIQPCSLTLN